MPRSMLVSRGHASRRIASLWSFLMAVKAAVLGWKALRTASGAKVVKFALAPFRKPCHRRRCLRTRELRIRLPARPRRPRSIWQLRQAWFYRHEREVCAEPARSMEPAPKRCSSSTHIDLVADHTIWRNICSAVLDGDIFPQLHSTPLWLKALFAILAVAPEWRNGLLGLMLWIQLQTIFYTHDFRVYHGYIPVIWP
ncbi:hypothetical protein BU16DRAFT_173249 [Lophium mytilinum]|uniref:Uncharacterized protein n=1 Tax=Lophium mytilinum TaxID=390894 RepID=A0A6A6QA55_9PEZI|nr:hypothetical protein BU16DRAFT_173249 [Lophium mytilinum]